MSARIVVIGTGKVATHLAQRFHATRQEVVQVYGRHLAKAKNLAQTVASHATDQWEELTGGADVYVLAVSDRAIASVAALLAPHIPTDALVVHTSGATAASVLARQFSRYGVLYPLQTFSEQHQPDWTSIPICVHAGREEDLSVLRELGERIADRVYVLDDTQRERLHLAAVLVNNFVNHLYRTAEELLKQETIPFEILQPLILETALKVQHLPPHTAQTGPAIREDQTTIDRHLAMLEPYPIWQNMYRLFTQDIQNTKT